MKFLSKCQAELQTTEGLTGTGGSSFKLTQSHACGQEPSLSHHRDLPIWLLKSSHNMEVGFPRVNVIRESARKMEVLVMTLPWKACIVISIISHSLLRPAPFSMRKDYTRSLGAILEACYHTNYGIKSRISWSSSSGCEWLSLNVVVRQQLLNSKHSRDLWTKKKSFFPRHIQHTTLRYGGGGGKRGWIYNKSSHS